MLCRINPSARIGVSEPQAQAVSALLRGLLHLESEMEMSHWPSVVLAQKFCVARLAIRLPPRVYCRQELDQPRPRLDLRRHMLR